MAGIAATRLNRTDHWLGERLGLRRRALPAVDNPNDSEERQSVEDENCPGPRRRDDDTAERRADRACEIEAGAVQRNCGCQLLLADELGNNRLPGRCAQGAAKTEQERKCEEEPRHDQTGIGKHA